VPHRLRRHTALLTAFLFLFSFALPPVVQAEETARTRTREHFRNARRYVKDHGFFRGMGRWLQEDWRITKDDAGRVVAKVKESFGKARAKLAKLRRGGKKDVLQSFESDDPAGRVASVIDTMSPDQVATLLRRPPAKDEAQLTLQRAAAKKALHRSFTAMRAELSKMSEEDVAEFVGAAEQHLDRMEHDAGEKRPLKIRIKSGLTMMGMAAGMFALGLLVPPFMTVALCALLLAGPIGAGMGLYEIAVGFKPLPPRPGTGQR
jgi:hypothetical protein